MQKEQVYHKELSSVWATSGWNFGHHSSSANAYGSIVPLKEEEKVSFPKKGKRGRRDERGGEGGTGEEDRKRRVRKCIV